MKKTSTNKEHIEIKSEHSIKKPKIEDDFLKEDQKKDIGNIKTKETTEKIEENVNGNKKKILLAFPKFNDAYDAGSKDSSSCTLIIIEGDSKTFALSGLSVLGRNKYGVYPLKRTLLNVQDATPIQISKNDEIQALITIIGLKYNEEYNEHLNGLRYGSILLMMDQDHNGANSKGLFINFIHKFWPSLLKVKSFLKEFNPPVVQVTNKKNENMNTFYSIMEYNRWRDQNLGEIQNFDAKFNQGLGTYNSVETKTIFQNLKDHVIEFQWDNLTKEKLELAFGKKQTDQRKKWIEEFTKDIFIDRQKYVKISDFIDRKVIKYHIFWTRNIIPRLMDGLKPVQRKILFSCFKRELKKARVSELTGYISEHLAYHLGEFKLSEEIIKMAQDFVGSNNISLIAPIGQYGTRLDGGKDSAFPRFLFTELNEITRKIFRIQDDPILNYLEYNEFSIEPEYYFPIIPMVLVNQSNEIGSPFSTSIPSFNPLDIVANIKRMLNKKDPIEMKPWYKGFKGKIELETQGVYQTIGIIDYDISNSNIFIISELPIGVWTSNYKNLLEKMLERDEIEEFQENHSETQVKFLIRVNEQQKLNLGKDLIQKFNLSNNVFLRNMVLFDTNGKIKKYNTPIEILKEFFENRLELYSKRKKWLLSKIQIEIDILENQIRFISDVLTEKFIFLKRSKEDLIKEFKEKSFYNFKEDENYNYLLEMPLWSFTNEKLEALKLEKQLKQKEANVLEEKDNYQMWMDDLNDFEKEYSK